MAAKSRHAVDTALYHFAENLAFTVCANPAALPTSLVPSSDSIHDKLQQLYMKQMANPKQTTFSGNPRACPNLLSILVKRDNLNTLVINLKPLDQGYSILIKSVTGTMVETINLPYTEKELLNCIEQEEIPHTLVDLLEQTQPDLFYDGCVIAEIRDGRRGVNGAYKTSYILLKPSHRSILADINSLTNDQFRWSQDDRFILESKLLIATSEPLCLDPTPAVGIVRNRLLCKKRLAQTEVLRRSMRPYTARGLLKRKMLNRLSCRKELPIFSFLKSRGNKSKYPHSRDTHIKMPVVDSWKLGSPDIETPIDSSEVQTYAKELEKPQSYHHSPAATKQLATDCTPVVVEEYTMETERPVGKLHRSRLIILKKPSEDRFIGELYIERNEWNSSKCVFELGTAPLKDKYISQFIEIFTEEGRRQVKIIHSLPGQPPKVVYTSGAAVQPNLSQVTTTPASQNVIQIPAASHSATSQPASRLSADGQSTIRLSADNQSAIRFSLPAPHSAALSSSIQSQGESLPAAQSMSSTDSSGASLMLGRQGLKIQGGILPSPQTPQPDQSTSAPMVMERSLGKERLSSVHTIKTAAVTTSKPTSISNVAGLGKATLLMSRSAPAQLAQLSGNQTHKLIGIQTSTPSSSGINIQNIAGLQTVQGLQNVQVSLTSLSQGGIAVPVSLIGGMSGNQPIFLSGPLSMMAPSGNNQQASQTVQSSSAPTASHRPMVMTTQAGNNQQLLAGHQGLITLPVTSTLAQQILAANKQRQNPQQQPQFNIVNTQQVPNQQISSQILTNQQNPQQAGNIKQTSIQLGQMLANQQGPIQISHLPASQQTSNVHIGHQIITQNSGNLQVRASQPSALRTSSMQVFHQSNVVQPAQQASTQIAPQHINIISSNQSGQSTGGQQVLHIPQNIALAHTGQHGQQIRMSAPAQQQQQKILFRQIGSPPMEEYHQSPQQ